MIGSDGYSVAFDKARSTIEVRRGREAVLALPVDSFVVGRVDEVSDSASYDPWPVVAQNTALPPGLAFRSAITATARRTDARTLNVDLEFEGGTLAALEISERGPGNFRATLSPQLGGEPLAFYRLRPRVDPTRRLLRPGRVVRRRRAPRQAPRDAARARSAAREHEQRSARAGAVRDWHARLGPVRRDRRTLGAFDVARQRARSRRGHLRNRDARRATASSSTCSPPITRSTSRKRYYDVTGYPRLPARWALGPWIWRDENRDQAQVEADLEAIRDLDLATTGDLDRSTLRDRRQHLRLRCRRSSPIRRR